MDLKDKLAPIIIQSHTLKLCLNKLSFEYKVVKKTFLSIDVSNQMF